MAPMGKLRRHLTQIVEVRDPGSRWRRLRFEGLAGVDQVEVERGEGPVNAKCRRRQHKARAERWKVGERRLVRWVGA